MFKFKLVLNETGLMITRDVYEFAEIEYSEDLEILGLNDRDKHNCYFECEESDFYSIHLINTHILSESLISMNKFDTNSQQYFLKHMMNYDFRTAFILSIDDSSCINLLFDFLKNGKDKIIFTLQDFDIYLEHFSNVNQEAKETKDAEKTENIIKEIIQYRDKHYSKEQIDAYYARKDKVSKGIELPTEQELLKEWVFTREGNEIEIIGYKGTAPKVKIPNELEDGGKIVKIDGNIVNAEHEKYLIIHASLVYSESMMHLDNNIEILYLDDKFFDMFEDDYYSNNIIQIHGVNAKSFDFSMEVFEEQNGPCLVDVRNYWEFDELSYSKLK